LTLAAFLVLGGAAAQAPAPAPGAVPESIPYDIPYGTPISLERAKHLGDAAAAEAKKRNWKHGICIVGPMGDVIYFQKIDGTQNSSFDVSVKKARASAAYRRSTKVFMDAMESGHPYVATLPHVVAADGGLPIIENGKLIGAIGVGGGTAAQDGLIAQAGVDAMK
jgi:uncharacterized protein GlcG (DUF336 family)